MLQSLTIEHIAVIKHISLELPDGFVAITGETGAGKSIVIDAINAVLGERTGRDLIRTGENTARVTAVFTGTQAARELLNELELPQEDDGTLLLSRTITSAGKSSCRINGEPVTAAVLRRVGAVLLNIHGQHDNQALLAPQKHVDFIDAVAENAALRADYRQSYQGFRALLKQQEALRMDETEKARRLDMLQHQIAELEDAQVQTGEREALQKRRDVMQHSEKILQALGQALRGLAGEDAAGAGAAGLAHEAAKSLIGIEDVLPTAASLAETVRAAAYELEESAAELRIISDAVTFDPAQADEIERRLDTYYRLSRKYGADEAAMLDFLEKAKAEEASIVQSDERILALDGEIEAAKEETIRLARLLSKSRKEAGAQFAQSVIAELADLDMPHVKLEVHSEKVPLTADGGERVEFLISANAGEEPKPLAKIASGGELSRIMLAMKRVLAEKDATATLIFDEIDAGVSGRAAQKIGRKLREVSRGRQVLCVTHLAQIAALAESHLFISKSTQENETTTQIEVLDRAGRQRELARIMGGEEITAAQLAAAEEMLRRA